MPSRPRRLAARLLGAALVTLALTVLLLPRAAAQDEEVPPAGPPLPVSERLRAQGHAVDEAEARYLDASEQLQEAFLQAYITVQLLAEIPPATSGWRPAVEHALQALIQLDPGDALEPPPSLRAVHTLAVRHRAHLRAAAEQWLAGVQADDPGWMTWGVSAYGAAEQARLEWHRALWERYGGRAIPGLR